MPHKLLFADDSVTIQRVIELTFAGEDVEVITVGDGQKAIERIGTDRPDIVLTDIGMPERNGYEVAEFVKTHPDLKHIPVVLLTGAFESVDEARVRAIGCDGWLVKPFEPQLVINRVRDLLQGRGSGAQGTPPPGQRPSSKGQAAEQSRDVPAAPPPAAPQRPPSAAPQQPPSRPAARPSPAPAVRARASAPTTVARQSKPADAMEEYFDRLDAAFANLDSPHPSQSDDRQVEDGRDQALHRGEPSGSQEAGEELENWDLDTGATADSAPQTSNPVAASDSDRTAASPMKPRAPSVPLAPPVRQASSAPPAPPVQRAPAAPPAPPTPPAPPVRQASSAPPAPPVQRAPATPPAQPTPPAPPVRQASSAPPAPPVQRAPATPPAQPTPPAPPVRQASSAPPAPPVQPAPAQPAPPAPSVQPAPATPPAPPAPPAEETAQPSQPAHVQPRAEPKPEPAPISVPAPSLADAFTALLAAEQRLPGQSGATQPRGQAEAPAVPDELVEELTRRVLDGATDQAVRDVVADTVSQVAERLVRDEIERIKGGGK